MKWRKRGRIKIIVVILVVLVTAIATGFLVYDTYFSQESIPVSSTSSSSGGSVPSGPSRCSLVAQNDSYVKPDFDRLMRVMENQPLVLDVPEKGRISLRFFHFTEGCRIYDKSYIISDGRIMEGGGGADIYVTLASSYVDRIDETNFCDVVKEARANDGLGQWTGDVSETTLLWRYKSMLKYKECLGLKLNG